MPLGSFNIYTYVHNVLDWLQYEKYNSNWITDYILIKLFQSEADIYVVPYPHIGHCMKTPGYTLHCKQLDSYNARNDINYNITKHVFDNLKYYDNNSNTSNKKCHLFLLSDYDILVQPWLIEQPLIAMYGPRLDYQRPKNRNKNYIQSPNGHIIIPQFNSAIQFQPSYIIGQQQEKRKQQHQQLDQDQYQSDNNKDGNNNNTNIIVKTVEEKKRNLSLVFIADDKNKGQRGSPRLYRTFLLNGLAKLKENDADINNNDTTLALIGGLPFISSSKVDTYTTSINSSIYDLYSKSIFCPVLPGDIAWQRRFFDVINCGCIPVVISYPINKNPKHNTRSWYVPEDNSYGIDDTWSVEETYPFVLQQKDNNIGINYSNFVIEITGNETNPGQSITNLITTLNTLLTDHHNTQQENENDNNGEASRKSELNNLKKSKSIIQQKQDSIRNEVGITFLYGVGPDAHRTNDAFAYLIRSLQSYSNTL